MNLDTLQTIVTLTSVFGTLFGWGIILWKGGQLVGKFIQQLEYISRELIEQKAVNAQMAVELHDKMTVGACREHRARIEADVQRIEERLVG